MKNMHIAWIKFQRRQESMKKLFCFETYYLPLSSSSSKLLKFIEYLKNSWKTFLLLAREKPETLWVQLPQTPLLWVGLLYKTLFNQKLKIIADCHNAMFRSPWNRLPLTKYALQKCDLVVVHNIQVKDSARQYNISDNKVLVISDPPATFENMVSIFSERAKPLVIFPASFAADEPIDKVIEAASLLADVSFIVTGNFKKYKQQKVFENLPENISFVGYLPTEEFDRFITGSSIVLALTLFDGIQLSVCGEAIGASKPMVLSDTSLLRRLYPKGTEFVAPTGVDISNGIKTILDNYDYYVNEMSLFKEELLSDYRRNVVEPFFVDFYRK